MPEISGAIKRTVVARRADGYTFNVKVTLPADYKEGTRLPAMFWFYPREYDNQAAYERAVAPNAATANRFHDLRTAVARVPGHAGLCRHRTRCADLRQRRPAAQRQLRRRPAQQPVGRHRCARHAAHHRSPAPRHRRSQLRRLQHGERDGAHPVLQGGHRRRRRLQPHAHAQRLPERTARPVARAPDVPRDVAVPVRRSAERRAAACTTAPKTRTSAPTRSTRSSCSTRCRAWARPARCTCIPYEDHGPIAKETVLDQWARWVAWLDKYVKNANTTAKKDKITSDCLAGHAPERNCRAGAQGAGAGPARAGDDPRRAGGRARPGRLRRERAGSRRPFEVRTASHSERVDNGQLRMVGVQFSRSLFVHKGFHYSWLVEVLPAMMATVEAPPSQFPTPTRNADAYHDPVLFARYTEHEAYGVGLAPLGAEVARPLARTGRRFSMPPPAGRSSPASCHTARPRKRTSPRPAHSPSNGAR